MEPTVRLLCSLTSFFYPLCECKIHVGVGTGLLSECNCCFSVSGLLKQGQQRISTLSLVGWVFCWNQAGAQRVIVALGMLLPSWTLRAGCVWGSTGARFYIVGSDQLLGITSYDYVGLQCLV